MNRILAAVVNVIVISHVVLLGATIPAHAIEELVSLNQDHPFSYSRDELIEMLDEALVLSADPK